MVKGLNFSLLDSTIVFNGKSVECLITKHNLHGLDDEGFYNKYDSQNYFEVQSDVIPWFLEVFGKNILVEFKFNNKLYKANAYIEKIETIDVMFAIGKGFSLGLYEIRFKIINYLGSDDGS